MSKSYKPISSKYISTTGIMHNHTLLSTFLDNLFPVGSVVIRADNKNPNTLYGGTWSKIASGRCLWGASSDSELNTTVDSGLPNITGTIGLGWGDGSAITLIMNRTWSGALYAYNDGSESNFAGASVQHCYTYNNRLAFNAASSNSIYGAADFVRPPQYKVYFWRRTA